MNTPVPSSRRGGMRRPSCLAAGPLAMALAAALATALTACGGGGGGGDDAAPTQPEQPPAPVASTLTGTAATGAPFANAAVQVTDATGATVCDTATGHDGTFRCTLAPTVQRPLLLRAAKDETVLYSATAATGDARANITPLTHIIVTRLAPAGDPAALAGAVQTLTAQALQAQSDALVAALQPLLTALGVSSDPLDGELVANGTGEDKLLDAIAVTVRPDGTAANIEIAVKAVATAANPQPVVVRFRSDAVAVPAMAAVDPAAVSGLPAPSLVADLMQRLTACFALPLSQRVNAPNDTASVVGTANDVIAPACRTLFFNDDPATYLSNGGRVGRSAANTGSFAGLFRSGATGVVFGDGKFEYFRGNGDHVLSAKWRDMQGGTANDTYVARNVNGVLKLIGNQYVYSSAVRPYAQDRELLNTPQFSYYSTGYHIRVDNRTDAAGNPIFSKVLVTSPRGDVYTLLPTAGRALLAIAPDGVNASATSVLRLAAGYRDATSTAAHPSVRETGLVYASPLWTDAEIDALDSRGVWRFEFFHADPAVPNVVQNNRTLTKPYTIAEIRRRPFAELTASARASLIADSVPGYFEFTEPDVAMLGEASDPAWTVPLGALAPSLVSVSGRAPFGSTTPGGLGNRFDDGTGISTTARFATVFCSAQTASDRHCADNGRYAVGTTINFAELWGLGENQVEISKAIGLYRLP